MNENAWVLAIALGLIFWLGAIFGGILSLSPDTFGEALVAVGLWLVVMIVIAVVLVALALRASDAFHHLRHLRRQSRRGHAVIGPIDRERLP